MAVTFSDLHTEAGLKSLDAYLAGKTYISGDKLSKDDIKVYAAVLGKPGDCFPNASRWYESVSSHLAKSFPGKAVGVRIGRKAAPGAPAKQEEVETCNAFEWRDAKIVGRAHDVINIAKDFEKLTARVISIESAIKEIKSTVDSTCDHLCFSVQRSIEEQMNKFSWNFFVVILGLVIMLFLFSKV